MALRPRDHEEYAYHHGWHARTPADLGKPVNPAVTKLLIDKNKAILDAAGVPDEERCPRCLSTRRFNSPSWECRICGFKPESEQGDGRE